MGSMETIYVMQPYAHLEPLRHRLQRLGVKIVEVTPRETSRLIERLGEMYCGLTPLPLVIRYRLPILRGPLVRIEGCSPSLVVVLPPGYSSLCECRSLEITIESVATRFYVTIAYEALCGSKPSVSKDAECKVLIGDAGIRAWLSRNNVLELAGVFKRAFGFYPVMAVTAGRGCNREPMKTILERLANTQYSLLDVLRVARKLGIPLWLAERYLSCTRLDYREELVARSITLFHSSKHLSNPQPVTT